MVDINTFKYNKIHPELEIARGKIINVLLDRFYDVCVRINKMARKDKTDDWVIRFCWKNSADSQIDPVIPYRENEDYDVEQLKIDLTNADYDATAVLNEVNLRKFLKLSIDTFDTFYNSLNYDEPIVIKDTGTELIYKKNSVKYGNVVMLSFDKFYDNTAPNKLALFFCILYRYDILGARNHQLSVEPRFKNDLRVNFNINTELFGSCINRFYDHYCSLYYDLEKYFGSMGNVFDTQFTKGFYFANPPFDEAVMKKLAMKIIMSIERTNDPLGFVVVCPVWDYETMKILSNLCGTKAYNMGKYDIYDILMKSKYTYKHYVFCKNNFMYYDFSNNKYIGAVNTHIFIVKNEQLDVDLKVFESLLSKNKLMRIPQRLLE